jgi:hypothetical protein
MTDRKAISLNLTQREMDLLEELCRKKELSKTALLRQALRLFEVIEARLADGEKLVFEDGDGRLAEMLVL